MAFHALLQFPMSGRRLGDRSWHCLIAQLMHIYIYIMQGYPLFTVLQSLTYTRGDIGFKPAPNVCIAIINDAVMNAQTRVWLKTN